MAYDAAPIVTDFAVVLTGAGISFDPPSSLPRAEVLALEVWSAVRDSLGELVDADLDAKVRQRLGSVRMEQFLELLTKKETIPTGIIIDVYQLVAGAAYNENHQRLAAIRAKHFTVNMDTLIEDADHRVDITHLHGRWNEPESIRTTVAHYSQGLDPDLRYQFTAAIRDATVLVIGYSGRDTDVMPLFDDYPPKRLVWVGPNMARWEYEVVQLRERYDRGDFGPEHCFEPFEMTAGEYLPTLVRTVQPLTGSTTPHPWPLLRERLERETTSAQRIIAIGNLLFDLGFDDELRAILQRQRFHGALEIRRRKIMARSLARRGNPQAAFALLAQRPSRMSEIGPWLRNATEIDANERRAARSIPARWFWRTVLAAMIVLPFSSFRQPKMLRQVRRAKRLAVAGRTQAAVSLAARVTRAQSVRSVLSDDLLVDSLTWEADALKSIGALKRALESATRADRLGFYGNPSQAAYAKWKLGEIRAAAGPRDGEERAAFTTAVLKTFGEAIGLAEQVGNRDTLAWLHGTYAEVVAPDNVQVATWHLDEAERLGALAPERPVHGRTYHLLQRAVIAMVAGELSTALARLDDALRIEGGRVPGARVQAQQLREELLWRQDPSHDLAGALREIAEDYQRLEMRLNEARAQLAAATLLHEQAPTWIIAEAETNGWNDLRRRAQGRDGPYPWRWDILL